MKNRQDHKFKLQISKKIHQITAELEEWTLFPVYVSSAETLVVMGNTDSVIRSSDEQPQHYLLSNGTQSGEFAAHICHLKHTLTGRKVAVCLKAARWDFYL